MNTFVVILQIETNEKKLDFDADWWREAVFGVHALKGEEVKVLNMTQVKGPEE